MRKDPRITIVTVCLNAAATIEKTLRSVAEHGYQDIEHIVVDGGSTDGTLAIVERHRRAIASLCSEPDAGISDAFNKGVRQATGELVGILNADDFLLPGALGILAELYWRHPDADVFYGPAVHVDGRRATHLWVPPDPARLAEGFAHPAMWPARRAYERFGLYSTALRFAMDVDWALRARRAGARFLYTPERLGAFRAGGLNQVRRPETIREMETIEAANGVPAWRARARGTGKRIRHALGRHLPTAVRDPLLAAWRRAHGRVPLDLDELGIREYL